MAKQTPEDPIDSPPVLRVLILEDNSNDAKLAVRALERGGPKVQFEVTESAEVFQERLGKADYDLILADFNLRGWTAFDALEILKRSGKDIPLVVITGSLGDEAAAECIKRGAADFILKDRPARLPAAVQRAQEEKRLRIERRRAEEALLEERHLLLTLMDNLPDGIYFKDRESRFTRINKAQAKLFGLSDPSQAVSKTDFDFFTAEHAEEAYKDEREIIRTGQPMVGKEEKETWPDGHITWVSTTKMPRRDANGNVTGTFGVSRNITERKRVEELLRESEERFRATFENAGIGIALVDMQGHPFKCNPALQQMLGYSEEELGRMPFTEFSHPDDRELDWELFRELTAGKREMYELEKRFLKKGSGVLWGLLTVSLVKDRQWSPLYAVGMVQDITERKRAEEALRESEEKYRSLVTNIPDVAWTIDSELRFAFISKNIERMSGFSADEIYQEGINPYFASLHPDDVPKVAEGLRALFAEGRPFDMEVRAQRKGGGEWKWIHDRAVATYERNGIVYADGLLSDITERKRAEEALAEERHLLHTLMDNLPDMIYFKDRESHFTRINLSHAIKSGLSHPFQGVGKTDFDFYPAEYANKFCRDEQEIIRTGHPVVDKEEKQVWPDGHMTWASTTKMPLRDPNGDIIGTFGVSRDITKRKLAEEALRESEERFRTLAELLPEIVYEMDERGVVIFANRQAHEITGYTEEDLRGAFDAATFFAPSDRERARQNIREAMIGKNFGPIEYTAQRKDGSQFPVITYASQRIQQGKIVGARGIVVDITERKRAEEALRDSEEKYRVLYESSLDAIMLISPPKWEFTAVNPAAMGLFAARDEQQFVVADPWGLSPEYQPDGALSSVKARQMIDVAMEKGSHLFEWTHKKFSGEEFLATVMLTRMIYRGKPFLQATVRDITERKRTAEELQQSRQMLKTVLDTIPQRVFWKDRNISYLGCNKAFAIDAGLKDPAEIIGKNDFELAWRETAERYRADDKQVMEQETPQLNFEEPQSRPDGSLIYLRSSKLPLRDRQGKVIGMIGTYEDITEQKLAEAEHVRLVTAIEQSAEAVVITNSKGDIEYVNPAFTRITGYSREEAVGRNPRMLKSDRQNPAFYQQLWETILAGKPWQGELINQRKDGGHYTEQMSIAPVKGVHGEVTHFIATKRDVTERKALEAQLQQAAKMEAVGRLAGGVAHDFNNLLTVINGYSEILMARLASDEKASDYLQEINNAGERAASLTRQLLAFSRRQVLAPQVLDLNSVVSNLEKMLRRLIGEDVKLRTVLDSSLERVKADPGQIEQVLMNLALNARDAMPLGGNLTIETRNVELDEEYTRNHPTAKPGPHVMLAISDTGAGMSPETQAHIFEPFFTTKGQGKGTGLGLATVYGIVKQSEGSIWLYSELGQGTVFKVYFPVVTESPAEREPAKVATDSAAGTETILVVEDEEGVRSLVRLALASAGYRVLETEDAESALALCASHSGPIHLLLTDVVMPQMSGPTVAEKVRALRPGIKVLYMSGYTDDSVVHHGVLTQDVPFIQKPFSPVALRKKVREVLGGKQGGEIADA